MVDTSKFVNHFELSRSANLAIHDLWPGYLPTRSTQEIGHTDTAVDIIHNLLTPDIVQILRKELEDHAWLAVGLDGKSDHFYDEIGNYRLSNYSEVLAERLWERLSEYLPNYLLCDAFSPTCHDGHERWKPVGINPLFRYIRYAEGGKLVGHYDDTFAQSDTCHSLMTLVIYLTTNNHGATRFLEDRQLGLPIADYNFEDWKRAGNDSEVLLRVYPRLGDALMFGHRILHDSEPLGDGDPEKIIIRTDIMFEKA